MRPHHLQPQAIARSAFARYFNPPDVIVLAVRWYLRFALSYRDVEELLEERGIEADHTTIYRWVQRFTPLLAEAARPPHLGTLLPLWGREWPGPGSLSGSGSPRRVTGLCDR